MPSVAATKYYNRLDDLDHLRSLAIDARLRPISRKQKQVYLHSYLAATVASWDSYVKAIVTEYCIIIANPLDIKYHSVQTLLQNYIKGKLEKFNTPNFENTRNLLIESTGYDPLPDWIWQHRNFTSLQTRQRLNEILKVRHSFAHGFDMPLFAWNQNNSGRARLTMSVVDDVRMFLCFLVDITDRKISNHLNTIYNANVNWY